MGGTAGAGEMAPDTIYAHAPGTVPKDSCSRGRPVRGGRSCACRYYPRQEPYGVVPLVRICAGGGRQ
jgi:hypothetical protein